MPTRIQTARDPIPPRRSAPIECRSRTRHAGQRGRDFLSVPGADMWGPSWTQRWFDTVSTPAPPHTREREEKPSWIPFALFSRSLLRCRQCSSSPHRRREGTPVTLPAGPGAVQLCSSAETGGMRRTQIAPPFGAGIAALFTARHPAWSPRVSGRELASSSLPASRALSAPRRCAARPGSNRRGREGGSPVIFTPGRPQP